MLKLARNKLYMILYFILGSLILEMVAFSVLGFGVFPEYFWMNLSLILAVAILVSLVPNFIVQYVVFDLILLVQLIFIYVNYSLYAIYGDLFSVEMFALVREAGAAITSSFIYWIELLQLILTFVCIVIVGLYVLKVCLKSRAKIKDHIHVGNVLVLIVIELLSCGFYALRRAQVGNEYKVGDPMYVFSDTFLMNTNIMKLNTYAKFGTYGYMANLIFNAYTGKTEPIKQAAIDYFSSSESYNASNSDVFGIDAGNNVIAIMMESLEWFGFGDGTYDANVGNLSNEITPNIYALIYGDESTKADDSLVATNFFAKSKTNISEGTAIIGSYPVGRSLASLTNKDNSNTFGYALPNILKQNGYTTSYIHSNVISFYDRDKTHSKLGFDVVVGKDGIKKDGELVYSGNELLWENWAAEGEFAENAIDYIIPKNYNEKPFYSFYLNVSSHGSYEYNEAEEDCMKYRDLIMYGEDDCVLLENGRWVLDVNKDEDDLTYTNWYQNVLDAYFETDPSLCLELLYYECGVKGLDDAIGVIVQKLKSYNIYDKTTLILFSDHYSYYNHLANRFKGFDNADFASIELNTIPMILSSPNLKTRNGVEGQFGLYDEFCSAYDIVPTLLDLLGIDFKTNYYLGDSIFNNQKSTYTLNGEQEIMTVYYSNTGGLFNDKIYTFDLKNFVFTDDNLTNEDKALLIGNFKHQATKLLEKLNYIHILNLNKLYSKVEN